MKTFIDYHVDEEAKIKLAQIFVNRSKLAIQKLGHKEIPAGIEFIKSYQKLSAVVTTKPSYLNADIEQFGFESSAYITTVYKNNKSSYSVQDETLYVYSNLKNWEDLKYREYGEYFNNISSKCGTYDTFKSKRLQNAEYETIYSNIVAMGYETGIVFADLTIPLRVDVWKGFLDLYFGDKVVDLF